MKVYLVTDMEGISLAFRWEQVRQGHPWYPRYQKILTKEVNAAVEGAYAAGADTVVVNDGHGGGDWDFNLLWEDLHPAVRLERPDTSRNVLTSLDETFDAVLLIGYHAMEGRTSSLHPEEAARRIRQEVQDALRRPRRKPFTLPAPYDIQVTFKSKEYADEIPVTPGLVRLDERTLARRVESAAHVIAL